MKNRLFEIFHKRVPLGYCGSIVLLSAILLGGIFIAKFFMLKDSGSYSWFLDVFRVSNRDIVFILVLTFILIILPALFYKRVTLLIKLKITYAVFVYIYLLSVIAQAILFKTTGFGLTREYLQNFFHNPGEDFKMVLAEVHFGWWLILLAILISLIYLARISESMRLRRLAQRLFTGSAEKTRKIALILILCFLISLECLALLPMLESVHPAIKQVALFDLMQGLRPEQDDQADINFEISSEDRLDRPVILEAGEQFKPFNVVLIIFESLTWKYCDLYNPSLGATPFLAELGKKGKVIERLYTVDPHTSKALVPIIAGIYPYPEPKVMEARPGILPEKALPHLLRKFGYRTAFFKTANNYEDRQELVANLGYEVFRGLYHMPQEGFAYVNYFGREEMMMLKPSLEWVDQTPDQPFFLTYLTLSTHHEYGYPPDFPAREFFVNNDSQNRYLNAVRYTDSFIEKLFDEFKKRNLEKKTIFIILGDHGEAFGEHGLSGHNYSLWEEGLRVPGIIYAPGIIKESGKIEGFRSVLDIVPTICDLLGLDLKEGHFIGKSLLSSADDNRELFFTGWSKSRVMGYRKGREKFLFPIWSPGAEIYDNQVDSYDRQNLFDFSGQIRDEAAAYREKTRRWWEAVSLQYRQWEKESSLEFKSSQPEDFTNRIKAVIDNLITIYGYGYFPDKTEPGRTVYINVGLKCENKVKRPLQLKAILHSDQSVLTASFNLTPRLPLENLRPGEYVSAEAVISIPPDWPIGMSNLYIGIMDEKGGHFIKPTGPGFETREDNTILIGKLNIFSADDTIE